MSRESKASFLIALLLTFVVIIAATIIAKRKLNRSASAQRRIPNEQFCGGFAGITCPEGYECIYDGKYPDAGGVCLKN